MSLFKSIKSGFEEISDSLEQRKRKGTVDQSVKMNPDEAESIFMSQFDINKTNLIKQTDYEKELLQKRKIYDDKRRSESPDVEEVIESNEESTNPICPFCQTKSEVMTSKEFYKTDKDYNTCVYFCPKCDDVYVNTRPGTLVPYGMMTNGEGRMYRKLIHELTEIKRKDFKYNNVYFYQWVAEALKISKKEANFAALTVDKCKELISVVNEDVYQSRYAYIFDTYPKEGNIPEKYKKGAK